MKKCELLSPAGNMEMLKYAVSYGADAVYLAGNKFGARKFANNFNNEELIDAINYAHLYGVNVYVTINTLIFDEEIEEFLDYVKFIHENGVDAVLLQDFGMVKLLHDKFPKLEIHASTQMHNNGANMIKLLENYGVKRVVMDREMSLSEIKNLPDTLEKEVFCHGALCVSYSGQCLFSSLIQGRSGNRGECAGMCRLPYRLWSEGKVMDKKPTYYLSLKDLCSINQVDSMLEAGVNSLKIEGRMKSPQYVGYITKIYRKLIDSYYEKTNLKVTEEEMKNMKLLYYRGFTKGFLGDENNVDINNPDTPNHVGIHMGTYKPIGKKVEITLEEDFHQGDGIRFINDNKGMTVNFMYDKRDNLISSAKKGETVYTDNILELTKSGEVRKTTSFLLTKEIDELPKRKVHISGVVTIKEGKKIKIIVSDGTYSANIERIMPSSAINRPITKEDVKKQITKTGSTVYEFTNLTVNLDDNLFVNIKDLNELRREVLERLDFERTQKKDITVNEIEPLKLVTDDRQVELNAHVNTVDQYDAVKNVATSIFTDKKELFEQIKDDEKVILQLDENPATIEQSKYMVSDYGSLIHAKKNDKIYADYMLNVANKYSLANLINLRARTIGLSVELTLEQIKSLQCEYNSSFAEVYIYGKPELLKMKYNPSTLNNDTYLLDRNNQKYLLKHNNEMNYLMSYKNIDHTENIDELLDMGIKNFRVDFLEENFDATQNIIENIHKKIYGE